MRDLCVLLVDDDDQVRHCLEAALATQGYRILQARNGREALEVVDRAAPDVVLLDLMMPEQSGMDVLLRLRAEHPETRVIVVSALDAQSMVRRALEAGARDFIAKPFHLVEVRDAVRRLSAAEAT